MQLRRVFWCRFSRKNSKRPKSQPRPIGPASSTKFCAAQSCVHIGRAVYSYNSIKLHGRRGWLAFFFFSDDFLPPNMGEIRPFSGRLFFGRPAAWWEKCRVAKKKGRGGSTSKNARENVLKKNEKRVGHLRKNTSPHSWDRGSIS